MKCISPMCLYLALILNCINSISGQRVETIEIDNNKYFFSDTTPYSPRLNWFLAYQYCRSIGMDLLSMPSNEDVQRVTDYLRKNGKSVSSYWTSGNQLGSHMWIWMTSGQPFNATFNFWPQGSTPFTKSENSCMYLQNDVWHTSNCMDEKAFVCQLTRCYFFNYAVTNTGNSRQGVRRRLLPDQNKLNSSTIRKPHPNTSSINFNNQTTQEIQSLPKMNPDHQSAKMRPKFTSQPNIPTKIKPINAQTLHVRNPQRNIQPNRDLPSINHNNQSSLSTNNLVNKNEIIPPPVPFLSRHLLPPPIDQTRRRAEVVRTNKSELKFRRLQRKEEFSWAFPRHN